MITLEVFADVVSPWSYIAKRRLEAALRLIEGYTQVKVVWLPFELDPGLPPDGINRRAWRAARVGNEALAKALDVQAAMTGRTEGLDLAFDQIERTPNTRDAHRLIALAGHTGIQDAVVEALFRAYFTEGHELCRRPVLLDIVASAGLDREHAHRLLESSQGITDLWAARVRATKLGVKVPPCLILNRWQPLPRLWDPAMLAAALQQGKMSELLRAPAKPVPQRYGFSRTRCGCDFCRTYCRHIPGRLDVDDLAQLCPAGQDIFTWAEQHLLAVVDSPYPKLVPMRQANGHCHWYNNGRCAVHENAPYGCAFFDAHQSPSEVERRSTAANQASLEDAARNGLYTRVWRHLSARGLTRTSGDRLSLERELRLIELSMAEGTFREDSSP